MGRLTLNVLLPFAQFEREVIGNPLPTSTASSLNNLISATASFGAGQRGS